MRGREKHSLELRRRNIYPAIDHPVEKPGELRRVAGASLVGIAHAIGSEEHRQQRAGAINASGLAGFFKRVAKAEFKACASSVECSVRICLPKSRKCLE